MASTSLVSAAWLSRILCMLRVLCARVCVCVSGSTREDALAVSLPRIKGAGSPAIQIER